MNQIKKRKLETPFFIYDADIIKKQINKIRNAFKNYQNFQLYYPVKANNSDVVLEEIRKKELDVAVSSLEELKLVLGYGFENISYAAPFVPKEVIQLVATNNIEINYNDFDSNNVGLRLNPEIGWSYFKDYAASARHSQFGVPVEEIDFDLKKITRLHMHTSSDSYRIDIFLKALKKILKVANFCPNIETINIGGGIATPIQKDDKEFDIVNFGKSVIKIVEKFNKQNNKIIKIQFEPGNYIVRPAGYYVCSVMAKAKKYGRYYYYTNGTKHHLRGLNNIEKYQFFRKNKIKNLSVIVGASCQRSDMLIKDARIPELKIGDLVLIPMAGAYCAVQADNFHLIPKPREYKFA